MEHIFKSVTSFECKYDVICKSLINIENYLYDFNGFCHS